MKKVLIAVLISLVGNIVTKENVKELLNFIFDYLEKKALTTETKLDDEALDVIHKLLNEDELAEKVSEVIKEKIKQ